MSIKEKRKLLFLSIIPTLPLSLDDWLLGERKVGGMEHLFGFCDIVKLTER